ncbi:MAG: hypothetical protein QE487_02025 [Fluviicola sp.]|nr:hypothetical protein [Fluviicola sp.]
MNSKIKSILKYIDDHQEAEQGYWEWEVPHLITELKSFNNQDWMDLNQTIWGFNEHQQIVIGEVLGLFKTELNDNEQFYGEIFLKTEFPKTAQYLLENLAVNVGCNQSSEFYSEILKKIDFYQKNADRHVVECASIQKKWILENINRSQFAKGSVSCV